MTPEQKIHALEERLFKLENIEAIRMLRCRYHELVNEDQGGRLWELFTEDASVIYGGRPEVFGRDNIRDFFATFPVQAARQFIHNHVVHIDGNHATGYSYLDGRPVRDGKSVVAVGRFDDEYVREGDKWLFKKVELTIHYMIGPADGWADKIPLDRSNAKQAPRP